MPEEEEPKKHDFENAPLMSGPSWYRWEHSRDRSLVPCGHAWMALVACISAAVALQCGYDTVAVGNERSANEGNM